MGYRIYLGSIKKSRLDSIKNASNYKELNTILHSDNLSKIDKDDEFETYTFVGNIPNDKHIQEFGKYVDFVDLLKDKYSKPIFLNERFNEDITKEHDLFIVDKEALKAIANDLRNDMFVYLTKLNAFTNLLKILVTKNYEEELYINSLDTIFKNGFNNEQYELDFFLKSEEEILKKDKKFIEYKAFEECFLYEEELQKTKLLLLGYLQSNLVSEIGDFKETYHFIDDFESTNPYSLTRCWKKDKTILELVNIYKNFDFENNELIIYGY